MKNNVFIKIRSFLDSTQKKESIVLLTLMVLSTIAELFGLSMVVVILNFFLNSEPNSAFIIPLQFVNSLNFFDSNDSLNFYLFIFFIIFFIKFLILVYFSWYESRFLAKFKEKISNKLFTNFLYRDPYQLIKKNSAEYLRNFTSEIDSLTLFLHCLLKIILDSIIVISLFAFLVFFNPLASISILFIFSSLCLVYYFSIRNLLLKWGMEGLQNKKKKIQFINESFSAIKYIKILSRENYFFKKFSLQNYNLSKITFKFSFLNSLPKHVIEFFLFITIIILLLILFKNNYSSSEIVKVMSIYTVTAFRLIPSTNRILGNSQSLRFSYPALNKLYNENKIVPKKVSTNTKRVKFKKEIKLDIKKFIYNKSSNFILKNIKMKILKKTKVGLIGASGSGKSTIINIFCGFIGSDNANVLVDGIKIKSNLRGWQKNIGYIPQKIVILNESLRENILFGLDRKSICDKKIIEVLKLVRLFSFYKKQRNGLSQVISEEGLNISGGEVQRIGIARALINDPEILILDEATSALDISTENEILMQINKLNKTTIFISHRANSLKYCNKIYAIEKGVIKHK